MAADGIFDEMYGLDGAIRSSYDKIASWLDATPDAAFATKRAQADLLFQRIGITFAVYGSAAGTERLIPFDIIPRILAANEWNLLERGLFQRVRALQMFLGDIYHGQEIIRAGIVPASHILRNDLYRPEMKDVDVPGGVYVHIAGIDVIRVKEGEFHVLEDNLRTPSGVSYMLENRAVMMRLFPHLFSENRIAPVDHYPSELLRQLRSVAPQTARHNPTVAVLTPGPYNSAYFEHAFLADEMGVELVEGQDLFVRDDAVWMRTTHGPRRVDVIYRRLDDDCIDPLAFNPDCLLGVPGLLSVYRNGGVTLANAIGTGIADDKSTYPYVPDIIRFYLGEEPILKNVHTFRCNRPDDRAYVLDHIGELVVKETQGSGGYGMLIGPKATKEEHDKFRRLITDDPDGYIAQPTLALSTCPTFVEEGVAPRHVDLRPFVLTGRDGMALVPGGLTRVALGKGSLVVNSSQGGGTKDTWVLEG
ncbi:circularly permuted type 2 ATP-grasp protein [Telmatospirillum sp.]|uniref:circularly permuted type 2 ATP-grasp protein n=1 Tax=Telmatospirillum sp. TaxID=2079197 RepID=UPI002849AEC9|nr:circularly permuted type 2 ATP-grasp protein [Telmatospirillum sp.]MDR3440063.1 circularly permuted type 2 ATP-grasp protein [Telmatospirillum sp.]